MSILQRILILSWALAASLLMLSFIGSSNLTSSFFGEAHVSTAVDVSFVVFTVIFALIFWRIFKRQFSIAATILLFLPPLAVLWLVLAP